MENKGKRINVIIDPDVDLEFRKIASAKMLFQKGWYSKAVEDALKLWIETQKDKTVEME